MARITLLLVALPLAALVPGLLGCGAEPEQPREAPPRQVFPTPFSQSQAPEATRAGAFAPLPRSLDLDQRKVRLGARLFRDRRVSGDGRVACVECHAPEHGGSNGQERSALPNRPPVGVNIPSVLNAAFLFRFAWSGRFPDIGEQIDFAMTSKAAMAGSWRQALTALREDHRETSEFAMLFPDGLTEENLREVLCVYSLSLVTPDARFDRYLRGELELSPAERRGYTHFKNYGCSSCHQGIAVGGNMVQRFGVMHDYFADRGGKQTPADLGLFAATGNEEDRHVFRVPSLRNVELTAPYFHDASAHTLEDAITTMAHYQLDQELPTQEVHDIAAFLKTLTGDLRAHFQ